MTVLIAIRITDVGVDTFSLTLKQKVGVTNFSIIDIFKVEDVTVIDQDQIGVPEEQAEDWEGADVDAASGDGRKNSSDESGQNEDNGLPDTKVQDGVVGLAFLFSEIDLISFECVL